MELREFKTYALGVLLFVLKSETHDTSPYVICLPSNYSISVAKINRQKKMNYEALERIQQKMNSIYNYCPDFYHHHHKSHHHDHDPLDTCDEFYWRGHRISGIYRAYFGKTPIYIYCQFHPHGKHWMVLQRRVSSREDFFLDWRHYKLGFGNKYKNFWLGLENIHIITSMRNYELRIDMEDWHGSTAYAEYRHFRVLAENTNYTIHVTGFHGSAGDALQTHNNQPFSTKDRDHDSSPGNCAEVYLGAWWYASCHTSNLNGYFYEWGKSDPRGVTWRAWKDRHYSLRWVEMKIRLAEKVHPEKEFLLGPAPAVDWEELARRHLNHHQSRHVEGPPLVGPFNPVYQPVYTDNHPGPFNPPHDPTAYHGHPGYHGHPESHGHPGYNGHPGFIGYYGYHIHTPYVGPFEGPFRSSSHLL